MSDDYFAHSTAVVDPGATIGKGTKVWHFCHIMPKAILGERCNLGQNVFVADDVRLGENVKVQNNVSIYSGVICEANVFLGPSMVFTNVSTPRSHVNRRGQYDRTLVREGASIGANATIVCGVTLGRYSFVAAGSVVTKDVPDHALVMGVPATVKGYLCACGVRLEVDPRERVRCGECGLAYALDNGALAECP